VTTENALITRRSFHLTLLAAILALVFVVALAGDADAKHRKPKAYFSKATITEDFLGTDQPFEAPDSFDCRFDDSPSVHDYVCKGGETTFRLSDALARSGNPPPGEGFDSVAGPDSLTCHWDGNLDENRSAEHFICEYSDGQHTHIFRLNEMVSVTYESDDDEPEPPPGDRYLPPRGQTVPTVVPSGADDVGGGSVAGLVGLLLAACGVVAGTVVIARRRFLHDS
jgi:hypothetical protein